MVAKPKLLELFCNAGGSATGYTRAGFDVTGVDIEPQPLFPYRFVQADAIEYVAQYGWMYDAITASPPCQAHSWSTRTGRENSFPDFLPQARFMLMASGKPYIIENVVGAPMLDPITLCGTQFGLRVFRHRQFESNIALHTPSKCSHKGKQIGFGPDDFVTVAGHGGNGSARLENWQDAMGIDWMDKDHITQAIPPAYTHFLGVQLMAAVRGIEVLASYAPQPPFFRG